MDFSDRHQRKHSLSMRTRLEFDSKVMVSRRLDLCERGSPAKQHAPRTSTERGTQIDFTKHPRKHCSSIRVKPESFANETFSTSDIQKHEVPRSAIHAGITIGEAIP
jgi:hypothetical protein